MHHQSKETVMSGIKSAVITWPVAGTSDRLWNLWLIKMSDKVMENIR